MRKNIVIIISALILAGAISTLAAKGAQGVIAYPVPFNPRKGSLTIADTKSLYNGDAISVSMIIMDITGDKIFTRSYSGFPILWKGLNSNGETVANGLYYIKLSIENLSSGDISTRLIRILVKK